MKKKILNSIWNFRWRSRRWTRSTFELWRGQMGPFKLRTMVWGCIRNSKWCSGECRKSTQGWSKFLLQIVWKKWSHCQMFQSSMYQLLSCWLCFQRSSYFLQRQIYILQSAYVERRKRSRIDHSCCISTCLHRSWRKSTGNVYFLHWNWRGLGLQGSMKIK